MTALRNGENMLKVTKQHSEIPDSYRIKTEILYITLFFITSLVAILCID